MLRHQVLCNLSWGLSMQNLTNCSIDWEMFLFFFVFFFCFSVTCHVNLSSHFLKYFFLMEVVVEIWHVIDRTLV